MDKLRKTTEVAGADHYDPLHPRRKFSWKVFLVAVAVIVGGFVFREDISDMGFGIAMAACAIIAIAIAAPSAFSESWLSEAMPDVAAILEKEKDASAPSEVAARNSSDADAV